MPLFALICDDKPDSLALRMQTRPAHFEYLQGHLDKLRLGGPVMNDQGHMAGSLIVIEVEDLAAAEAFAAADPYGRAGLFAKVQVKPFTRATGSWGA